jgi:hypothetical protein
MLKCILPRKHSEGEVGTSLVELGRFVDLALPADSETLGVLVPLVY